MSEGSARAPMRTCPDGHAALRPQLEGSLEGASCLTCRGIWLPGETVTAAIGRTPAAPEHGADGARTCPEDGAKLRPLEHRGVTIDLCRACGGVWLDDGERERLRTCFEPGAGVVVLELLVNLLGCIVP